MHFLPMLSLVVTDNNSFADLERVVSDSGTSRSVLELAIAAAVCACIRARKCEGRAKSSHIATL